MAAGEYSGMCANVPRQVHIFCAPPGLALVVFMNHDGWTHGGVQSATMWGQGLYKRRQAGHSLLWLSR
jgi:hypothetical protein